MIQASVLTVSKLVSLLLVGASAFVMRAIPVVTRPDPLALGGVTWLYYKDLAGACRWYTEKLGSKVIVDQGFAKVYQMTKTSFVGLVDEAQGMHRASPIKPVALAFVTEEVDSWYAWLVSQGVEIRSEPTNVTSIAVRSFTVYDCEGYTLEFQEFLPAPINDEIRQILGQPKTNPASSKPLEDNQVSKDV